MNKRQKAVIQHQLTMENIVLKELEHEYKEALKDINLKIQMFQSMPETQSRIYHRQYQETLKKQVEAALEKLHSDEYTTINQYLHDSYTDAFIGTMYDLHGQGVPVIAPIDQNAAIKAVMTDTRLNKPLYASLGVDVNKLKRVVSSEISRGIAAGLAYAEIARNIEFRTNAPISRAKTIVRTEGHRIQQASTEDARQVAKSKGANVVKMWDATLDGKTRSEHRHLDGQIRETDEPFEYGGKKAMYPGDFGDPAMDCNCRCLALTRSRSALDAEELKILKERAVQHGLMTDDPAGFAKAKEKDFADFKKKYMKAADKITSNMAKASKIEANGLFVNRAEKLHRYAKKIAPIAGYEDFTCHADPDNFYIDLGGDGNDEDFFKLTPEEYAERIKASLTYKGGNVRIISCQAGAKKDGAAQRLANALNVDVYAPTETVHVTENGEMFVSDNDILAEIWYNEGEKSTVKQTGEWKVFKPRKE